MTNLIDLIDGTGQPGGFWQAFCQPDPVHGTMPKWVWNVPLDKLDSAAMREQLQAFATLDRYAGVMLVQWGIDGYLSDTYLEHYREAVKIAASLDLKIILWDENGFPSGHAGGLLKERFPQHTAKALEMTALDRVDRAAIRQVLKRGTLMGAVRYQPQTFGRIDVTAAVTDLASQPDMGSDEQTRQSLETATLSSSLLQDGEQLLLFTLEESPGERYFHAERQMVDYLDPEAVAALISLTHEQYRRTIGQHFGSAVIMAFYDEPAFYHISRGRIWTAGFNTLFTSRYGFSPVTLYPALFMPIGPDTAAARNLLLGLRSDLYADAYVGSLSRWCSAHGIRLTGHMDQEEIINPVPLCGDLMKVFRHQHMPGVDEISFYGRGSRAYKLVSSAACNYDKPLVMCEVYGAMGEDMPVSVLYKEIIDLYAKGVNFLVPHGTWYDITPDQVTFPPELSYRSQKFASDVRRSNELAMRLGALLQYGRHCADIALYYPIEDLQAYYQFTGDDPYLGGLTPSYANYLEIGELLSLRLRQDFTYLHPEVLREKCSVDRGTLCLNNRLNPESYTIVIVPAMQVISQRSLAILAGFARQGGILLFCGRLPEQDAELAIHRQGPPVADLMADLLAGPAVTSGPVSDSSNTADDRSQIFHLFRLDGGLVGHIPVPDAESLDAFFSWLSDIGGRVCDLCIIPDSEPSGGNLTGIHKVLPSGSQVVMIGHSGDETRQADIRLRGRYHLRIWNPHDGSQSQPDIHIEHVHGQDVTCVHLVLPPVTALLLTDEPAGEAGAAML